MPGFAECGSYDNGVLPTGVAPVRRRKPPAPQDACTTNDGLHSTQRSPAAAGAGTRQGRVPHSAAGGRQGTAGGSAVGGTQLSPARNLLPRRRLDTIERNRGLSKCSFQV